MLTIIRYIGPINFNQRGKIGSRPANYSWKHNQVFEISLRVHRSLPAILFPITPYSRFPLLTLRIFAHAILFHFYLRVLFLLLINKEVYNGNSCNLHSKLHKHFSFHILFFKSFFSFRRQSKNSTYATTHDLGLISL